MEEENNKKSTTTQLKEEEIRTAARMRNKLASL
jgi:hypothetical protein